MAIRSAGYIGVQSRMDEVTQKIQLSAGDRQAFLKKSDIQIKQNKEIILRLRDELKQKRKNIATERTVATEMMLTTELKSLPEERKFLINKPSDAVVETMDEKTIDLTKVLDILKFKSRKKQNEFDGVKVQIKNCKTSGTTFENDSRLREIENSVDKTNMKCKEAGHIRQTYHQIQSKLEDEQMEYGNVLDEAEIEIKRLRAQLKELKAMQADVCEGRNVIKEELEKKEKEYQASKRKREQDIERAKKEADDLRHRVAEVRNVEQKDMQSLTGESLDFNPCRETAMDSSRMRDLEENFGIIKAAVGVSDTNDVVKRFESQKERQIQLNEMKEKNENRIKQLIDDRDRWTSEYQCLQFSIEDNGLIDAHEKLKEILSPQLHEAEKKMEISKSKLENSSKLLTNVKTGVEHLTEKFKNLNIPPETFEINSEMKEEIILSQLNFCSQKLFNLYNEEKLLNSIVNERKLFVKKRNNEVGGGHDAPLTETKFEDDSSDENDEASSRNFLKKQSQEIIDNKTRNRHIIKRKKRN